MLIAEFGFTTLHCAALRSTPFRSTSRHLLTLAAGLASTGRYPMAMRDALGMACWPRHGPGVPTPYAAKARTAWHPPRRPTVPAHPQASSPPQHPHQHPHTLGWVAALRPSTTPAP
eukprot:350794-Chlamydomonas_euryale.AAC.1